ncbi:MAG: hypothetical protein M1814_006029 [Vezdaea aestivalis]|nr:MAG: hypothetical protein M1814_006029 [Vezdaea aestivalis]
MTMAGLRKHRKSQTKSESPVPITEEADIDGDAPVTSPAGNEPPEESNVLDEEWEVMQTVLDNLYKVKDQDGEQVSYPFHRMINKRSLPQYYRIIKNPVAMSTIKAKISKRAYQSFADFVEDFAYICHNAQLYNRPEAGAYQYALLLREALTAELHRQVDAGKIPQEKAILPDLGEIPPPSPQPHEDDGADDDEDDEEDEEDEDADVDDSEEEHLRKRKRRGPRSNAASAKREAGPKTDDAGSKGEADSRKRRGRPPRVDTPMEARVKAILKGLRKFKTADGQLKCSHFERLPDKAAIPDYFKKSKRKKYQSVDHFMKDVEIMFENAKLYNLDNSPIFKDAVDLQKEARILAEQEKNKPDSEFLMEDGRVPLPGILHNGVLFKVGDWVHITNLNDATKPIVAQIYRTWQDPEGKKWVNACWYYRPEQTVHRAERHFYDQEVVKTGQYRDHRIDEVVDKCFVMFFTRFYKGRPRNFPLDKEIYVCESRYNEEKHKLNKIKTWASCLPDEVRDKDYEMDLFEQPRKMRKVLSPIAHRLPDGAKSEDELPEPTWGSENAPPIVGAVHNKAREPNESPPPEPTPSPPPAPPPVASPAIPSIPPLVYSRSSASPPQQAPLPNLGPPGLQNPAHYSQQFATRGSALSQPSQPSYPFSQSSNFNSNSSSRHPNPVSMTPGDYQSTPSNMNGPNQNPASNGHQAPRAPNAFVLSDAMNSRLPEEVRDLYHTDDQGRVLFFTTPGTGGASRPQVAVDRVTGETLCHSARYLAARKAQAAAKKAYADEQAREREEEEHKRKKLKTEADAKQAGEESELLQRALLAFAESNLDGTEALNRAMMGLSD